MPDSSFAADFQDQVFTFVRKARSSRPSFFFFYHQQTDTTTDRLTGSSVHSHSWSEVFLPFSQFTSSPFSRLPNHSFVSCVFTGSWFLSSSLSLPFKWSHKILSLTNLSLRSAPKPSFFLQDDDRLSFSCSFARRCDRSTVCNIIAIIIITTHKHHASTRTQALV